MRILIVFATAYEAAILKKLDDTASAGELFIYGKHEIMSVVTGVGGAATAWEMSKWLCANPKPDLVINAGIAGSYDEALAIGSVVMPVTERFADLGIESDGKVVTLFEAGLSDPDQFPFSRGIINCSNQFTELAGSVLKKVNAITVNTCTGSLSTIERIKKKFNPDIETMEGATFFYICSRERIPFLSVRSVSNKVEPRSKALWNIPLALDHLAEKLNGLLLIFD